ncbi:hypothetical protein Taro_017350, partial [Colocasia esculenta]|nr:hypothetical protein [Colocasia esculenta]
LPRDEPLPFRLQQKRQASSALSASSLLLRVDPSTCERVSRSFPFLPSTDLTYPSGEASLPAVDVFPALSSWFLRRRAFQLLLSIPVAKGIAAAWEYKQKGSGFPLRIGVMPSQSIETGHQDAVHDVAMDYYGKRLATASSDGTIKIIGVSSGSSSSSSQPLATLSGHQGPVWRVAWAHPKFGSVLASCGYDGRVIIWREGGRENEWIQAHVFTDNTSSVNSVAWAPYELGLCLAYGSSDGSISVFTARPDGGWDAAKIDGAHPVGVMSVSWAPPIAPGFLVGVGSDEPVRKLVSGGCDNTVKVWKVENESWRLDGLPALQMHKDWVRDVAWAPNLGLQKSTIASASQDGTVIVWTAAKEGDRWEGKVLHDFKTAVWRLSWSTTGNILAVADGDNNVTLWKEAVDGEWQQVSTVEP